MGCDSEEKGTTQQSPVNTSNVVQKGGNELKQVPSDTCTADDWKAAEQINAVCILPWVSESLSYGGRAEEEAVLLLTVWPSAEPTATACHHCG